MGRQKLDKPDGPQVDNTRPTLTVTESVSLTLAQRDYGRRDWNYHQSATTADIAAFVREAERKLGRDAPVEINSGLLTATKQSDIKESA